MQIHSEIKHFVQKTLGCSCPEEVFNKIDYQKENGGIPGRKVIVGDRLLIYMISADGESNIQGVINSALERGVEERDRKGFNRFRLVLVALHPNELRSSVERAFDSSGYTDERTHIHVVGKSDVEGF